MKKLFFAFTLIIAVLFSSLLYSGCYVTKAGKLNDVVGTYRLTSYTNDGEDIFAKKQIEAYLIAGRNGKGYYYYKDSATPAWIKEITVNILPDEEEAGKYSYIEYRFDHESTGDKLAYASSALNANRYRFKRKGDNPLYGYYVYTGYERVDKAEDLSYLEKKLGNLPNVMAFGQGMFDGVYASNGFVDHDYNEGSEEASALGQYYVDPFVYFYIDFKVAENKLDAYYMLKSNEERVVIKDVAFEGITGNGGEVGYVATVGEYQLKLTRSTVFEPYYGYINIPVTIECAGLECNVEYVLLKNSRDTFDIEYQAQEAINWYNQTKPQE